jgi:hypothetical protein
MRLITSLPSQLYHSPFGPFGQDDSKKPWMMHDQKCERLGFKRALQNTLIAAWNKPARRRHKGAYRPAGSD